MTIYADFITANQNLESDHVVIVTFHNIVGAVSSRELRRKFMDKIGEHFDSRRSQTISMTKVAFELSVGVI